MTGFRFRLARALEWYGKQCRLQENLLSVKIAARDRSRTEFMRAGKSRLEIERDTMQTPIFDAGELLALTRYRHRALQDEARLARVRMRCEVEVGIQWKAVQAARQRVRLIEKIRERKLAEHTVEADRELEELAADAFRAVHFAR